MNPASKSSLPVISDPGIAAMVAQLKQENALYKQSISIYEMKVQKLEQELRLERIQKYGKHSEKLSDLQLQLLDLEPGVSSVEIEAESQREPLPETTSSKEPSSKQKRARQQHPGRKEFPAHLERVEEIMPLSAEQCACGKCGGERKVIGYGVPRKRVVNAQCCIWDGGRSTEIGLQGLISNCRMLLIG
jgi:hypothetical protein